MIQSNRVAVIGGGAAGFFAAIAVKENHPNSEVIIFEKTRKLLSKVKVSGGGRCNVTNACFSISELSKAYPRGGKKLKKAFRVFNAQDTIDWFEKRGVPLMVQENNYVFPQSQKSQSIIDCFLKMAERLSINILTRMGITEIKNSSEGLVLHFSGGDNEPERFDKVIIATGGSPKRSGFEWLEKMGHKIVDPVPSLFTFNMPDDPVIKLMGVVADHAIVSIQSTKLQAAGPLLITHWGMSGPAILKLSAFGARILSDFDYTFKVQVNWVNEMNHESVLNVLKSAAAEHPKKNLTNVKPFSIPARLWEFLLIKSNLASDKKWEEVGKKGMNKLVTTLTNDVYSVKGKTTFKEEFVTCGGVSLESIDFNSMQSRVCPGLYFAGEVLDIDAITGGYNFQAAWTTAFISGHLQ